MHQSSTLFSVKMAVDHFASKMLLLVSKPSHTHTHTHTHTPSYWRASAWPDGSTRSFPTCIKLFLWFYSQFPVAMLIAPNCPSQLYGSNQALHISAAWAGFTADSTDHATWRVVTDIRKYDLMWHLPYVLNVV